MHDHTNPSGILNLKCSMINLILWPRIPSKYEGKLLLRRVSNFFNLLALRASNFFRRVFNTAVDHLTGLSIACSDAIDRPVKWSTDKEPIMIARFRLKFHIGSEAKTSEKFFYQVDIFPHAVFPFLIRYIICPVFICSSLSIIMLELDWRVLLPECCCHFPVFHLSHFIVTQFVSLLPQFVVFAAC